MTKIEKWAHVAEIIGAAAVVTSVIYLAYQVRENSTALRGNAAQTRVAIGMDWDSWLTNQGFAAVVVKANDDYGSLSPVEKLQFDQYVSSGLNLWEEAFDSRRSGMLEEEYWQAWDRSFRSRMREDSWQTVWRSNGASYNEEFGSHVGLGQIDH